MRKSSIARNEAIEGETLETKVERMLANKEKIEGESPLIYSERKDGILAGHNIRTDRFEVAIEAMDKVAGSRQAKREERHNPKVIEMKPDAKGESTQGTGGEA